MSKVSIFFKITLVGLISISLSILGLFENFSGFIFAKGSTSTMVKIATSSWQLKMCLALLLPILLTIFLKFKKKMYLLLFSLILIIWIIAGRTVGFVTFPDGKIITGWFHIGMNDFNLCDHSIDCETQIDYKTSINKLPFWRIQIKNDLVDKTIFIGPIVWNKTVQVLDGEIGAGTYSK